MGAFWIYVVHRVKVALQQLHHHDKDRFGIETSYRIKNQSRIRTTTKNPVTRLLFVALAFILVNLWVYWLWYFVSRTQRGGRVVTRAFNSPSVTQNILPLTLYLFPDRFQFFKAQTTGQPMQIISP
jgi:IS4 transposase